MDTGKTNLGLNSDNRIPSGFSMRYVMIKEKNSSDIDCFG